MKNKNKSIKNKKITTNNKNNNSNSNDKNTNKVKAKQQQQVSVLKSKISECISQRWIEAEAHNTTPNIIIWAGLPNSGKTYNSIQRLKQPGIVGCYNAPLRLLASEIYDTLNKEGILCSLITGEERKVHQGSRITSSTIEMLNYNIDYDVAIIDEAQLIASSDRGNAWVNALIKIKAKELHIIVAPNGLDLITRLLDRLNRTYTVNKCERFVPLNISEKPNPLNKPIEKSAYVVFSRARVLELKEFFESSNIDVSVIYGNLPPEVKKLQVEKFTSGQTKIVISTDAIGLGVNLPLERVIFAETEKWDGMRNRPLNAAECQQIGNRAGRYGFYDVGYVSALNKESLNFIKERFNEEPEELHKAMIAPEIDELELFNDERLCDKLYKWKSLSIIPDNMKDLLCPIYLDDKIDLSREISLELQRSLGLDRTYLLTLAPVGRNVHDYWLNCVRSISKGQFLPLPGTFNKVESKSDIDLLEDKIKENELYLWLGLRREFEYFAPEMDSVSQNKYALIKMLDEALMKYSQLKSMRCINCNCYMPAGSKHKICSNCYSSEFDFDF